MITIISYLLMAWVFFNSYLLWKKNPQLIKRVYTQNLKDYLWSFIMVICVLSFIVVISTIGIPNFLKFSWPSLLDSGGSNLIVSPMTSSSGLFNTPHWITITCSLVIYLVLSLCLPYLAKSEEDIFRSCAFSKKERFINSLKFGFVHMIVGVPIYVAMILCVIGWIFSQKYVNTFKKNYDFDEPERFENANETAVMSATSLHAKYNLWILTIAILSFLLF